LSFYLGAEDVRLHGLFFKKKLNSPISRRQFVLRSFSEVEGYGQQVALPARRSFSEAWE
jgi:hypothetical protein